MASTHDLARLIGRFDEQTVLSLLQTRFDANQIYTNVNQMMLAINPYTDLGLYAPAVRRLYGGYGETTDPPPHVFGVASGAFKGLISGQNQCILVTGESGAGKTESCRRVLQYLASASAAGESADIDGQAALHVELQETNCVLEAFGNARTVMNDNSSRFGKFLAVQYDSSAQLVGASISTYLLEKTRVVSHSTGERSFHIFYSLLSGLETAELKGISLTSDSPASYRYTMTTAIPASQTPSLKRRSSQPSEGGGLPDHSISAVCAALEQVGMSANEREHAWGALAAVLQLGNVSFEGDDAAEVTMASEGALIAASSTLGLQMSALRYALVTRCIKAGAEFISTPNSKEAAAELRDGLAKALYARIFNHLLSVINCSLARTARRGGDKSEWQGSAVDKQSASGGAVGGDLGSRGNFIGLLDIFGFEIFERNSLEQLLINFTNEQLQAIFNEIIFTAAQEENVAEGLPRDEYDADTVSNAHVISLLSASGTGLFSLLNDECVFPKGTDSTFLLKFTKANAESPRLKELPPKRGSTGTPEPRFSVQHYAGEVEYCAAGMLDKNKDALSEDLQVLMRSSSQPLVSEIFSATPAAKNLTRRSRGGGFRGVAVQFISQLDALLRVIGSSQPHFIRCIRPNSLKRAHLFDDELVLNQLRCGGVLEAVRVFSSGYPDRMLIKEFVGRYSAIVPHGTLPPRLLNSIPEEEQVPETGVSAWEVEACQALLRALGVPPQQAALGRTKVFMRAGVAARLQALRELRILNCVARCQAAIRGRLVRRWSARRIAEARNERLEREKEAARQLELTRLRHEQQAEFERALLDSEARQVKEAEEMEAARVKEEEERASAAAAAEAAAAEAAARRHDLLRQMQQLQEIIVSESGARQELGARVEELSRALEDAEARCAELQRRLADQQVAANRREAQLRAEVAKWREAAGLSEKREQQARQLAEAEHRLLEVDLCERMGELARYREKYLQLLHEQEHGIDRGSRESISAPQSSFFTRPRPWAALGASLGDLFSSQIGPLTRRGSTARGRDAAAAPSAAALRPVETEAATPAANKQSSRGADDAMELRSPTLHPSRLDWSLDELTSEYVAYLGLDPTHDAPLLWIAEDAARAPLPTGWEVRRDPQGSAYYMHTYTGDSTREHPRDEEFRQLVAQGRLEILHSGATSYAQSQQAHTERRSVEQTLCSPASTTVRAAVACSPSSTGGSPEYSFQVFIRSSKTVPQQNDGTDDASMIRCLSAQLSAPLRARGLPHFVLAFELDSEAKPHYVRIVQPGRYVLFRSVAETSWLSFGDKQEELAAVIFSEGMSDVYTMELLLPRSLSRDHTPVARVSSATDSNGLLRLNERGKEDSLLVFTGRVDVVQSSSRNRDAYTGVRLSSPSTNSANLEIRLPRGNTAQSVRYRAPIAPVHAFCAALALAHWSSTEAKSGKKR